MKSVKNWKKYIVYLLVTLSIGLILFAVFGNKAHAQTEDPILSMPDGQVILNISATERKEVDQDLLIGTLSYTATNKEVRPLQDEINKNMEEALNLIGKIKEVKVNTGAYQVHEFTVPRTKEKQWRGSQTLTMKATDTEKLLALAGKLQEKGFNMSGLSYTLSPDKAVEIQDGLMEAALKQLQSRADRAAKALGKSTADLRDVNVQSSGIPYNRVHHRGAAMMAMSADAEMSAPVAAAGETTITLTVSARALLKP